MVRRIAVAGFLLAVLGGAGYLLVTNRQQTCQVCERPMHDQTFYRIFLKTGKTTEVCCPRCGLRFQQGRQDVLSSEVADFHSGDRFDARQAFFVENSAVHLCCSDEMVRRDATGGQYVRTWDRCLPSLVAFKSKDEAKAFRGKNGGVIHSYQELLEERY